MLRRRGEGCLRPLGDLFKRTASPSFKDGFCFLTLPILFSSKYNFHYFYLMRLSSAPLEQLQNFFRDNRQNNILQNIFQNIFFKYLFSLFSPFVIEQCSIRGQLAAVQQVRQRKSREGGIQQYICVRIQKYLCAGIQKLFVSEIDFKKWNSFLATEELILW